MAVINLATNPNGQGTDDNDIIYGTSGNDVIYGGYGDDLMYGYAGNDTFVLKHTQGWDTYDGGDGYDTIIVDHSSTAYFVNYSVVQIKAATSIEEIRSDGVRPTYVKVDGIADFTNTKFVNILEIQGTDTANIIYGSAQNDKISTYAGDDILDGGLGADTLIGGTGNDTYGVDNVGDVVTEDANAGSDLVKSSITYTLGANLENLTLTGTAAINGTGNSLDNYINGNPAANTLSGGDGNDILDGKAGTDTMIGGTGNDVYYVDNTNDVIVENANAGTETVFASTGYALSANIETLRLTGTASVNGIGNAQDNTIVGNAGDNLIGGNEGNDTLYGGDGNDQIVGGPGVDTLFGENGNDTLVGNDGSDQLSGGAGNDLLAGQAGNDELVGGAGADQFYFNLGGGTDMIRDFQDGVDKFVLGKDIQNISVFTNQGYTALEFSNAASGQPSTYVLLQGIATSQIDASDFLWAA